jgi:TfoX/Sxy family transcriptional regulator of competence genes
MAVTPGFRDFVAEQLAGCGDVTMKRMFGAVGIYCGDVFFAVIGDDVLYLKVDDTTRQDFERAGCGPFRPYGDDGLLQRAGLGARGCRRARDVGEEGDCSGGAPEKG